MTVIPSLSIVAAWREAAPVKLVAVLLKLGKVDDARTFWKEGDPPLPQPEPEPASLPAGRIPPPQPSTDPSATMSDAPSATTRASAPRHDRSRRGKPHGIAPGPQVMAS